MPFDEKLIKIQRVQQDKKVKSVLKPIFIEKISFDSLSTINIVKTVFVTFSIFNSMQKFYKNSETYFIWYFIAENFGQFFRPRSLT